MNRQNLIRWSLVAFGMVLMASALMAIWFRHHAPVVSTPTVSTPQATPEFYTITCRTPTGYAGCEVHIYYDGTRKGEDKFAIAPTVITIPKDELRGSGWMEMNVRAVTSDNVGNTWLGGEYAILRDPKGNVVPTKETKRGWFNSSNWTVDEATFFSNNN